VSWPIPSDSRYREDLIWLTYGNLGLAEEWKLKIERVIDKEKAIRDEKGKKR